MSRRLMVSLIAAIVAVAVGVAGLGVYIFFFSPMSSRGADAKEAEAEEETLGTGEYLKLKNFVTDLADADRARYVDVTVALSMQDSSAADLAKKNEPQIRDIVLNELRTRTAAELAGAQGKEKLAAALETRLEPVLKERLKKVYVTDLVIQ